MGVAGVGYSFVDAQLEQVTLLSRWVAISEDLELAAVAGLVLPQRPSSVTGTVLGTGSLGHARGIRPGMTVVYAAWQGGRWDFDGTRCIITDVDNVLAEVTHGSA